MTGITQHLPYCWRSSWHTWNLTRAFQLTSKPYQATHASLLRNLGLFQKKKTCGEFPYGLKLHRFKFSINLNINMKTFRNFRVFKSHSTWRIQERRILVFFSHPSGYWSKMRIFPKIPEDLARKNETNLKPQHLWRTIFIKAEDLCERAKRKCAAIFATATWSSGRFCPGSKTSTTRQIGE